MRRRRGGGRATAGALAAGLVLAAALGGCAGGDRDGASHASAGAIGAVAAPATSGPTDTASGVPTTPELDDAAAEIDALLTELESLDEVASAIEPTAPAGGTAGNGTNGEAR